MGPEGFLFELTGGAPCLDLANTVDLRPSASPEDHLDKPSDLVDWAAQSGLLSPGRASAARRELIERPRAGEALLREAKEIREAIHAIFSAVAGGRPPRAEALDRLNTALPGALGALRLEQGERPAYVWSWSGARSALDGILPPIVESAADLMTSDRLDRVRECEAERCGWLFLDTSRNRTRRWCDMKVCGNRAKARRHYLRKKVPRGNKRDLRAVS
ncbi:MAG TPA: ABATE domain-containing protein [Candidatus Saccharimonadales bacterium]|nr:ABATE domain-containing protein [Candidatus Saccharimonadales bacterium]